VQLAAVAALTGPDDFVTGMVAEFAARREIVVDGLNALPGVTCEAPGGAFYAFPQVDQADEIAPRLLDEAGVALLPGSDFGAGGAGHLRLSFAASQDQLREGLARMGEFLAAR
jgi:aspartate aminotransferase